MVKIILTLLVVLIIFLVVNGFSPLQEGFVQCQDKSFQSWKDKPEDLAIKEADCKRMIGCKWKKTFGFNSGSCIDTCQNKYGKENCEKPENGVQYCEYKNYICKRKDLALPPVVTTSTIIPTTTTLAPKTTAVPKQCNFVPWGDTIRSCIDRCTSIEDRQYWGKEGCTDNHCYKICRECSDTKCKWYGDKKTPIARDPTGSVPLKQTIKAIPDKDKIQVMWRVNETTDDPVISFLIYYYKTYDSSNSVFTQKVNRNETNITLEENIQPDQYYTIAIYAINSGQIGPISNLERVKTDGITSLLPS